jgi:hypothetical protein
MGRRRTWYRGPPIFDPSRTSPKRRLVQVFRFNHGAHVYSFDRCQAHPIELSDRGRCSGHILECIFWRGSRMGRSVPQYRPTAVLTMVVLFPDSKAAKTAKGIPCRWGVSFSLLAGFENQDPSTAFIRCMADFWISGNSSRIGGVCGSLPTSGHLARQGRRLCDLRRTCHLGHDRVLFGATVGTCAPIVAGRFTGGPIVSDQNAGHPSRVRPRIYGKIYSVFSSRRGIHMLGYYTSCWYPRTRRSATELPLHVD